MVGHHHYANAVSSNEIVEIEPNQEEGAYVASRHTPLGVEIFAVGWDEAHQYRQNHSPETRQDVRIGMV
jgi:hypothetical protein